MGNQHNFTLLAMQMCKSNGIYFMYAACDAHWEPRRCVSLIRGELSEGKGGAAKASKPE